MTIAFDGTTGISASGNITGNYILGNGSQLTGITGSSNYSNSNVSSFLAGSATDIIPAANNTSDLGNATNQWGSLYLSNATLYFNSVPLSANSTALSYNGNQVFSTGTTGGALSVGTITSTGLANVASLSVQTSLSVSNTISAVSITATGNSTFANVTFTGNVTIPGNITQITGNTGQFFGNTATGFGAFYAGTPTYTPLANAVAQFSGTYSGYAELAFENTSANAQASGDFTITGDDGTETANYINMGITSSTWDGTQPNSLGNALGQRDGYLYVNGGDLVLGVDTAGTKLRIIGGGTGSGNIVAEFGAVSTPATSFSTGAFTLTGGAGIAGNVYTGGLISAVGNISTSGYLLGDGGLIGNINAGNITGGYANANVAAYLPTYAGNILANVVTANSLVGPLATASQTAITAVGTLTSLSVSGNTTTANVNTAGVYANTIISTSGNVATNNLTAIGLTSLTGNTTAANVAATGIVSATGNVSGGNITTGGNVSATGNVAGTYFIGNGALLTGVSTSSTAITNGTSNVSVINNGNVTIGVAGNPNVAVVAASGTYVNGVVSATGNITGSYLFGNGALISGLPAGYSNASVAAYLANSSTSGDIYGGDITASGQITVNSGGNATAIINGAGNAVGNIGSSSNYFNTVFAVATSAQYADLAESYLSDDEYAPGTVLSFGGDAEVTLSKDDGDALVAGVVSTKPAYRMNDGLTGEFVAVVALVGRVPCLVQGPVSRGAMLVSAGNGRARASATPAIGTVIGKALESFDGDFGTIEIVVGRV